MSALFQVEFDDPTTAASHLHLVVEPRDAWRTGPSLAARRAARVRARRRWRALVVAVAVTAGLVVLAWPGHALGGTTGTGLPTDLATGGGVASGMVYVVQSGDTIDSIAQLANPVDPSQARRLLVAELHSSVVVPGEHVLIP